MAFCSRPWKMGVTGELTYGLQAQGSHNWSGHCVLELEWYRSGEKWMLAGVHWAVKLRNFLGILFQAECMEADVGVYVAGAETRPWPTR